tara:strand:- start:933 stop:2060 length:1128 start_codon:yes stop_codon:yes gene_type:complete
VIQKVSIFFALVLLFLQLLEGAPSFTFPTLALGEYIERIQNEKISHNTPVVQADLVSSEREYDRLVFVGDVLLARNVEFLLRSKGSDYPYRGLSFSSLTSNPAVIGNFEAAIPKEHVPTQENMLRFSVDERFLTPAIQAGFTHFSLANNHSLDYGESGYNNTLVEFSNSNLSGFGVAEEVNSNSVTYINQETSKVAIIGAEDLSGQTEATELIQLIKQVSVKSDFQVIYIHWGVEYDSQSSQVQQQLARQLVSAGADLIVGHHPHVVQEVDLINGVPVFYSLGNYIFDQYFSNDVKEGLVLEVDFSASLVTLIPVTSASTLSQPAPMSANKHAAFLQELAKKSNPKVSQGILSGQIQLKTYVATSSKIAMIDSIN